MAHTLWKIALSDKADTYHKTQAMKMKHVHTKPCSQMFTAALFLRVHGHN